MESQITLDDIFRTKLHTSYTLVPTNLFTAAGVIYAHPVIKGVQYEVIISYRHDGSPNRITAAPYYSHNKSTGDPVLDVYVVAGTETARRALAMRDYPEDMDKVIRELLF